MVPSTALALGALPARLIVLPGVYRPQTHTWLLAEALSHEEMDAATDVLDIGTGTGALALSAARTGARVVAVDVSWGAVIAARLNAFRQQLSLRVMHGDFANRTQGRRFDIVVANPPYVPSARPRLPAHGAARGGYGEGFAQWLGDGLGVSEAARVEIERLFALPGQVWRTTTAFGLALLAVFGLSFGTVVQSAYEKVWDLPPARWWARWRHVPWLTVLIAVLYLFAIPSGRHHQADRHRGEEGLRRPDEGPDQGRPRVRRGRVRRRTHLP
ncbi:methyltransferase [Streptomyces sp. NBC_01255]|uniref:methyltransferase n=1 Tax=Streptomyces sp. NBC_01255 TaxID=2903798 RepID=UPI003FCDCE8A